ncbi:DUF4365 domain-containing protein [Vibrio cyclitrophicus]
MSSKKGPGGTAQSQSKEQMSLAVIRMIVAATGLNTSEPAIDNFGIDISLIAKDLPGLYEETYIATQLKCVQRSAVKFDMKNKELVYPLPAKNYNKLVTKGMHPKILILHVAPNDQSKWAHFNKVSCTMYHASYWLYLGGQPKTTKGNKTVRIPFSQVLTPKAVMWMMKQTNLDIPLFNCKGVY